MPDDKINNAEQKPVTVIGELSDYERACEEARKKADAVFNERSAMKAHLEKGLEIGRAEGEAERARLEAEIAQLKAALAERNKTSVLSENTPKPKLPKHGRR